MGPPASLHARLLELAANRGLEVDRVLARYVVERFLYRLSLTDLRSEFVLKGAMLLAAWPGATARATRGLDLLASGTAEPERVAGQVGRVLEEPVADGDGVVFDATSVSAEVMPLGGCPVGVRAELRVRLGPAWVPLRLDVGFGDVVTPGPVDLTFAVLLDQRSPKVLAYPLESVIAEKLEAIAVRGFDMPRIQDYYDLWMLADDFEFDAGLLGQAVQATFRARGTLIGPSPLPGLSPAFFQERDRRQQWETFLHRSGIAGPPQHFPTVGNALRSFLAPLLKPIAAGTELKGVWGRGTWR